MKDKFNLKKLAAILDMRNDQDTSENIQNNLSNGVQLKGSPLVILFCAILIASVGLNTNSTAVIIGAMLISPLMNPILAMGYAISTYDGKLFRKALVTFFTLFSIALTTSSIYFMLSPIKTATMEILARTEPGAFDFIIAFVGGLAGIVGVSRKEKSNVIPGVAIATALMPPLCTVGFGLASGQQEIAKGALYLFCINVFFIILSTFLVCKAMKIKRIYYDTKKYDVLIKRAFIGMSLILAIPLLITSYNISKETYKREQIITQLNKFLDENKILSDNKKVLFLTYEKSTNTLRLDCIGEVITEAEITSIKNQLEKVNIKNVNIKVVNNLEQTIIDYIDMNLPSTISKIRVLE